MSDRLIHPRNLALTGPILDVIVTRYSLGPVASISSHPGIHSFSTAESLSAVHVASRLAATLRAPFICMPANPRIRLRGEPDDTGSPDSTPGRDHAGPAYAVNE
jgi:hypothetical protein